MVKIQFDFVPSEKRKRKRSVNLQIGILENFRAPDIPFVSVLITESLISMERERQDSFKS